MEGRSQVPPMCSPRFADAAEQLEGLWQQGQLPDVHDFLARAGELSPAEIVAVLRIDQRHRWQRGERVEAEAYLRAWPLVAEDDRALELICCEFRLRQALGEAASLEEYLQRFPAYAARLQQQIELHWGLASEALVSSGKTMAAS